MVGYTVLATRYRPRTFDDVVGQSDAAHVLRAAIEGGRSAHAYLFSGPRGVGKTSMARILAKAWNCLKGEGGQPCGTCAVCRSIDESGDSLDVVEIDGASHNRVENVRELIEKLRFRPVEARYRVTIVDEVHMLSTSAFNALLKTLEEPPATVLLILLATDVDALLPTVRSRCQEIALRPMPRADLAAALHERPGLDATTADRLAGESHGCYGLAYRLHSDPSLSMLRESAALDAARLASASRNERFDEAAKLAGRWSKERASVLETLDVWRWFWRDRLLEAAHGTGDGRCSAEDALRALRAVTRARLHLLENTYPQLALEVMMLDLPVLAADGEEARTRALLV